MTDKQKLFWGWIATIVGGACTFISLVLLVLEIINQIKG